MSLYGFEEGQGQVVADVSGATQPLDLVIGNTNRTTWIPGGGLAITAGTVISSPGAAADLTARCVSNGAFTVEVWLEPANLEQGGPTAGQRASILTLSAGDAARNFSLEQQSDQYLARLRTTDTGNAGSPTVVAAAALGLTHLVVSYNADKTTVFYVNGERMVADAYTGDFSNWDPSYRLSLVNEVVLTAPWLGVLHAAAIYDRALSDAEVLVNYNAGIPAPVASPPAIVVQPADVSVAEPRPATFHVVASGSLPMAFQWRRDGAPIPGADGATYVLPETSEINDDGALFACVVSNAYGSVTSRAATLTVGPFVPSPLVIVSQPQAVTVIEPTPATFGIAVTGDPPFHFAWRRNGVLISGATEAFYTLDPTDADLDDGARFDVIVSNAYHSVTSDVAVLTVNPYVPLPLVITAQPQDKTVMEPAAAAFTVTATGDAPLRYQWRRQGTNIAGAVAATYTLTPTIAARDNGAGFDVIVSNAYHTVTSRVATLTVNAYVPQPPSITTQPADVTVTEPNAAFFSLVAAGDAPLYYQWRRDGAVMPGATASSFTLYVTDEAADDGATFDCVVTNVYGSVTSRVATLTVNVYVPPPPEIDVQPADVTVTEPAAAVFTVIAAGDGLLSYQWRRNGTPIDEAEDMFYRVSPTLASRDDGATFDVIVSSPYGSVTSRAARLTVNTLSFRPPEIVTDPVDTTVTVPDAAGFGAWATGDAPLFYQWRRNGTRIEGATLTAYILSPTALTDNGATFDCVVSNAYGSVTSRVAILTVEAPVVHPPVIDTPPADVTVTEPEAAGFSLVASGDEPMRYQWRRNGSVIPAATLMSYVLGTTTVSADNGAGFDCVVSNAYGSVTSRVAVLTVNPKAVHPPQIAVQPVDVSVLAPDAAAFSVLATGDEPMRYQWRRGGVKIAGATIEAYVLAVTAPADNGAGFDCVVSNAYGSVTSRVATLTVQSINLDPPQLAPLTDATAMVGAPLAFTVTATDADGTFPALTCTSYPAGAVFTDQGNGSGLFAWTPAGLGQVGDHTAVFVASDGVFSVTNAVKIHVSSFRVVGPAAGAVAPQGDLFRVAWTGIVALGTARIDLLNGTNTVLAITAAAPAAAPAVAWRSLLPPGLAPGANYRVRVADADNSADWAYSAVFTVGRRRYMNDFNGDGKSDFAVFDNNTGYWFIRTVAGATLAWYVNWGWPGAQPVPGDYDGDGKADLAVFDTNTGYWFIRTLSGATLAWYVNWGWPGAKAIPGDYDGDGKSDLAVYDAPTGYWFIRTMAGKTLVWAATWGWKDTQAIPGDYDGDGRSDMAVFDTITGNWAIRTVAGATLASSVNWGWPGANPVSGDYNGDGVSDLAVFDNNGGYWYAKSLSGQTPVWKIQWGWPGANPVPGDYNGDNRYDLAVFDNNTGYWFVRTVAGDTLAWYVNWGWPGARPIPSD